MVDKVLFSSNSDEWATPKSLFKSLDHEFKFTLDPCASDENHTCKVYFTKTDDGLSKNWSNNVVFCNPPYSEIAKWCQKCYFEWLENDITIVLLIPSRTDTKYFHDYIYPYCELRFIKGRLHFNESKAGAPFPSIICIFRGHSL